MELKNFDEIVDYFHDYMIRTVGPNSWLFNYITQEPWLTYKKKVQKGKTRLEQRKIVYELAKKHFQFLK